MWLGVISDTHGVVRPEALDALRGAHRILHAGDVGRPEVLAELRRLAPVSAVRGNVDRGAWADGLPEDEVVRFEGHDLYLRHVLGELDLDPKAAGFSAVVTGHSHQPSAQHRDGVLYLNPGSAGPRRFRLPVSLARIVPEDGTLRAELIELRV